jgi:endonuclease-3
MSPALTPAGRARRLLPALARLHPDARCGLRFENPLQLLVATILSAQCTDERVNQVTPALFARFPDAAGLAAAGPGELEALVRSTNYYRTKARNIRACCRLLVERHGGEVPGDLDALVELPGVGRKTANVVLGDAFGRPGITVDTHLGRLSRRLGLTGETDPVKVERDLTALIPEAERTAFSHRMITHGRQVCHARKPDCAGCGLKGICPRVGVAGVAAAS